MVHRLGPPGSSKLSILCRCRIRAASCSSGTLRCQTNNLMCLPRAMESTQPVCLLLMQYTSELLSPPELLLLKATACSVRALISPLVRNMLCCSFSVSFLSGSHASRCVCTSQLESALTRARAMDRAMHPAAASPHRSRHPVWASPTRAHTSNICMTPAIN